MRAVTYQAPGEVRVEEKPDPEVGSPDEAVVRVEATGVCGSDLHLYHGRIQIEEGFTLGHEYVGTVVAAGDDVTSVKEGDRVLGAFLTACGECFFCRRGLFHKCDRGRVFGHGSTLGSLQGAQADLLLVPRADMTLRPVPEGLSDDVALFAGDVMGTGYHAVQALEIEQGGSVAVLAVDSVEERLAMAESFGAQPLHLTEDDVRGAVKEATEGRGVDGAVDAVGNPQALDMACRLARKAGVVSATGVYSTPIDLHMGIVWIKSLTLRSGQANVIAHLDPVLERLSSGELDPSPLVTHHMSLDEAPEAYETYDRREALKIVMRP